MRLLLLFFLVLVLYAKAIGQQANLKDSLLRVVKTATQDSNKIKALCHLMEVEREPKLAFQFSKNADALVRRAKWVKGAPLYYLSLGRVFARSDYGNALDCYFKSLHLSEAIKDSGLVVRALFHIGNAYRIQDNPRMALPYFSAVEAYYKKHSSPHRINNLNLMGICHEKLGNEDSALFFFNRAFEMDDGTDPVYSSRVLRGLANVHLARGDAELAASLYRKSLAQTLAAADTAEMCQTFTRLSRFFQQVGNQDSAFYYGKKGLQTARAARSNTLTV